MSGLYCDICGYNRTNGDCSHSGVVPAKGGAGACPFCGSRDLSPAHDEPIGRYIFVHCNGCAAEGPVVDFTGDQTADYANALKAWNRRV